MLFNKYKLGEEEKKRASIVLKKPKNKLILNKGFFKVKRKKKLKRLKAFHAIRRFHLNLKITNPGILGFKSRYKNEFYKYVVQSEGAKNEQARLRAKRLHLYIYTKGNNSKSISLKNVFVLRTLRFVYGLKKTRVLNKYLRNVLIKPNKRYKKAQVPSFLTQLERSLLIILYRMRFVDSVATAAKLIRTGYICVNNRVVTFAYHKVVPGDVVQITPLGTQYIKYIFSRLSMFKKRVTNRLARIPDHLVVNFSIYAGVFLNNPNYMFEDHRNGLMSKLRIHEIARMPQLLEEVIPHLRYRGY